MPNAEEGYTLPFHAGLYRPRAEQRILWWKELTLRCRASSEALRPYVPYPLDLVDEEVTIVVTEYSQLGHSLPIFGGGIYLHARLGDVAGHYPIVTFATTDEVVCANREELGEPALLCEHSPLHQRGGAISATLRRHDDLLIAVAVTLDAQDGSDGPVWGEAEPLLHYKKIPNGAPGGEPLREVIEVRRRRTGGQVVQLGTGTGAVELGTTIWDFHQLAPLEVVGASFLQYDGGVAETAKVLWAEDSKPSTALAQPGASGGMTFETEGWGHPIHAPLYFPRVGQHTFWHKNLEVSFRADPEILKEFMPHPLEPADDVVRVRVTDHYQPTHGSPVTGARVYVRVKYEGIEGRYTLIGISTSDEVICANREELGMPMIIGDVRLWVKGNTWWGVAERDGQELIRIAVFPERLTERVVKPNDWIVAGHSIFYKQIPSADPDRKPWRQVLAMDLVPTGNVYEHTEGRGIVQFGTARWGLHRIKPIGKVQGSYYHGGESSKTTMRCLWEDRP